jgi:ubiquinone/menaquinone biosynthesis C-methylase UbiE
VKIPFDRVAEIYDKTRGLPPEVMRKIVQALVKEMKGYKTVLDIGVGTGRFAKPLQENGFEVVGTDISEDMMKNAMKKSVKNLLFGDACSLPFRDYSFDAALSVHVLHLIINWQTALKEICRVTKGELFSIAHNPSSTPISEAYEELAKEKGYDARHIGLSERELIKIIKPTKSIRVASYVFSADQRLTYLRQRVYSRQWKVPEDVDKNIVNELGKRFAGQEYLQEIHILRWNIKDLQSHLKSKTQH